MFWWFSRTNETYAFLPRVSWVGTSRISGRRFWGSWETLHAALETRARQYWCAFITFIYTLPVSKAGQVGAVGIPGGDCCLWVLDLKMKIFEFGTFSVLGFHWATNTHLISSHLWHASLPFFLLFWLWWLIWLGIIYRFFSPPRCAAFLTLFRYKSFEV